MATPLTGPMKPPVQRINCFECRHFFVTWEKATPYGCRGHGFKSRMIPSLMVKQSSGSDCLLFLSKK